MKWSIEDVINAPLESVERALFASETIAAIPEFYKSIERVQLLEIRDEGAAVHRAVYYWPSVSVPWFARRVDKTMTEWTEYLDWDREVHGGRFRIEPNMPDQYRPYFNADGRYVLERKSDTQTVRRIEADLTVKFGMMAGGLAERIIIGIVKRQFRREARLLQSRVQSG